MMPMQPSKKSRMLLVCAAAIATGVILLFVFLSSAQTPASNQSGPGGLSVWTVYWDWQNGLKDLGAMSGPPASVQAFGASFDSKDKLFLPKGMGDMTAKLKTYQSAHPGLKVYLSVVNDIIYDSGKSSAKNCDLVDRLMQSDESRVKHAADIVALAQQAGVDGVEIDYEKINDNSWPQFCDFCERLRSALQAKGKQMRVVLESGSRVDLTGLPQGPQYVMMAYNLYGIGTKPGPKADEAFIRKVASKLEAVRGRKSIAFATGGFDWDENGRAQDVTEAEAYALSQQSKDVQRDSASGDVYFTYQKDDGIHTVWYADGQTLKKWFDISRSLGVEDISFWRLGGTTPETLQTLGQ